MADNPAFYNPMESEVTMATMECPPCRGSGTVMTRDTGVCGTEEYGTCRRCNGTGKVDRDTAPETLARKVRELESRVDTVDMTR